MKKIGQSNQHVYLARGPLELTVQPPGLELVCFLIVVGREVWRTVQPTCIRSTRLTPILLPNYICKSTKEPNMRTQQMLESLPHESSPRGVPCSCRTWGKERGGWTKHIQCSVQVEKDPGTTLGLGSKLWAIGPRSEHEQ